MDEIDVNPVVSQYILLQQQMQLNWREATSRSDVTWKFLTLTEDDRCT